MMQANNEVMVLIHERFGFEQPIPGFANPIAIPAEASPFVPEVDPTYVFDSDMVRRLLLAYGSRENVMLFGEKGTGKSSLIQQFCARLNLPLISITGGPGVDETYLLGGKSIEGGNVKSMDGVLSYAVRHGIPVLIDEIGSIKPSVLVALNDILNGDQVITLKHHGLDPKMTPSELAEVMGGMTIRRHSRFRLFATDNTGGKAKKDPRYAGVNAQNAAVRSRFTMFRAVYMKPEQEQRALSNVTGNMLQASTIKMMVEFALRMRASFEMGDLYDTLSFRELRRWATKSLVYHATSGSKAEGPDVETLGLAFVDAAYTAMEETDQDLARETWELVFGVPLVLPAEHTETAQKLLKRFEAEAKAA